MKRTFTVEFTVDQFWIDDGFDMTDEIARDMLDNELPWANYDEISAKVVKKEDQP